MSKSTRFILKHVRLSYPAIAEAKSGFGGGEPKYGATLLISKDDEENLSVLRKFLLAGLKEKFPDKAKLPPMLRNSDLSTYLSPDGKAGWPLRDGDFKDTDGYAGMAFIHVTNKLAPFAVDEHNRPMAPSRFYAGCYVDAALESYAWENSQSGTKGVSVTLQGVKFAGDGDGFGAAPVAASEYFGEPEASDSFDDPNNYSF